MCRYGSAWPLHPNTVAALDPGIRAIVVTLHEAGIETYESCHGGRGHSSPEPMVRFHGAADEGYRAVSAALRLGLPVRELRRVWDVTGQELDGPTWELTFRITEGGDDG